ncbi:MAG TPA: phosphotransferase [Trebonia sp.]|nr:phosphotransferase [Trebonia sp.]
MTVLPRMSEAQAARVARDLYGVTAVATRLPAEHDDVFRLVTDGAEARFLRVSPAPAAAAPGPSFLTAILLHLAATAPDLPVQRVIPSRGGEAEVITGGRLVRMTTFLDGRLLAGVPSSLALRGDIGATLARLSRALRDFTHPAARRTHHWDLQNFAQLRPLLAALPSIEPRTRLLALLDRFDEQLRPALAAVPVQVIHTDFHGENLLVSPDGTAVCGVLDFGDSVTGPVAMDVAVAACYQLGASPGDFLAAALDVVAGYHAVDPLRPADLPLIRDFIELRLATRIIVSQWNAAAEPANSGYLLRRTSQAIEHFAAFSDIPASMVVGRLRAACGFSQ